MRIKINKDWITSLIVLGLCAVIAILLGGLGNQPVGGPVYAGTQGTRTDVFYDGWGNSYCYGSLTWSNSTDVTEDIKIPYDFAKPDGIAWYQWDTNAAAGDQAYADDERFWIDLSSWTPTAAIGTDSRSTLTVNRYEFKTNDGCEDGVVVNFVLVHYLTGNIW